MTDRTTYYAEAQSWAEDRRASQRRALRLAWSLAAIATGIAGLEAMALATLTPLKTVVPYTLLVDRQTGFAQALNGTQTPAIPAQSALAQALLAQYVTAREGFDITTLAADYRKVALWSAGEARRGYLAQMPAGAPDSPLTRLPRSAIVDASVESVSWIGPQTALVRFTTTRRDAPGPPAYWIATITYRTSSAPLALADRLINPLGFQVTAYHRDAEIPAVNTATPAPIPLAQRPQ